MLACVCVRACARVRACVRALVRECARTGLQLRNLRDARMAFHRLLRRLTAAAADRCAADGLPPARRRRGRGGRGRRRDATWVAGAGRCSLVSACYLRSAPSLSPSRQARACVCIHSHGAQAIAPMEAPRSSLPPNPPPPQTHTRATSAPGLCAPPVPHLHRDWLGPCHICTGTGWARATSAPGLAGPAHICGTIPAQAVALVEAAGHAELSLLRLDLSPATDGTAAATALSVGDADEARSVHGLLLSAQRASMPRAIYLICTESVIPRQAICATPAACMRDAAAVVARMLAEGVHMAGAGMGSRAAMPVPAQSAPARRCACICSKGPSRRASTTCLRTRCVSVRQHRSARPVSARLRYVHVRASIASIVRARPSRACADECARSSSRAAPGRRVWTLRRCCAVAMASMSSLKPSVTRWRCSSCCNAAHASATCNVPLATCNVPLATYKSHHAASRPSAPHSTDRPARALGF